MNISLIALALSCVLVPPAAGQGDSSDQGRMQLIYLTQKTQLETELAAELAAAPNRCTRNPMVLGTLTNVFNLIPGGKGVKALTTQGLLGMHYLLAVDELAVAQQELDQAKTRVRMKKEFEGSFRRPAADLAGATAKSESLQKTAEERAVRALAERNRLRLFVVKGDAADIGPTGQVSLLIEKGIDYEVVRCP